MICVVGRKAQSIEKEAERLLKLSSDGHGVELPSGVEDFSFTVNNAEKAKKAVSKLKALVKRRGLSCKVDTLTFDD